MPPSSELITLFGQTTGTTSTGDFSLSSFLLFSPVTVITIPAGTTAKIWAKRKSGKPFDLIINYANDGVTFRPIERQELSSQGELDLEKRRPIVLKSMTGVEAFKLSWDQTQFAPAVGNLEVDVEFGVIEDE
jgi:hypothetical protein